MTLITRQSDSSIYLLEQGKIIRLDAVSVRPNMMGNVLVVSDAAFDVILETFGPVLNP